MKLSSVIGKKQIMAVAGLLLAGFVFTHMLGNMLIFISPDAYNMYGHKLTSNPAIYIAEAGLVAFFVFHIFYGIVLSIRNRGARKSRYAVSASGPKKATWASRYMIHQGMIIAIFVVIHLITFKYGTVYMTTVDGQEIRDLFRLLVEVFQSPVYVVSYVFCVGLLAFHLAHGVHSGIQTLGYFNADKEKTIHRMSMAYGWIVGLGFMIQPLYVYLVL